MAEPRSLTPGRLSPPVAIALAIIFVLALSLRLYGLNWDEGRDLHPDELFVAKIVLIDRIHLRWPPDWANLLDPEISGLNPRSIDPATGKHREFAYGALPLFVTDGAAALLSRFTGVDWNGPDRVYLVGRVLSALFDSLTALLVFPLARTVGGVRTALFAALIFALTPMMIQLAHFFTTDSWVAFFVALCLVLSIRAANWGSARDLALAGFSGGLAMATKGSVAAIFPIVALAGLLQVSYGHSIRASWGKFWGAVILRWIVAGLAAIVGFGLFEPYALVQPWVYLQSLRTQADIVSGRFDVPFTRQFVAAGPLYPITQAFQWGYGPVAGSLALAGVGLIVVKAWRQRAPAAIVLVAWFVAYSAIIAFSEVRFLRYLAPLAPLLAVAAGLALARGLDWLRPRVPRLEGVVAPAVLIGIALWAAAFTSIYAGENPRLAASRWIYASVPTGSGLTAEYWDDALPRDFGYAMNPGAYQYTIVSIDLYRDQPSLDTASYLFNTLQRADYVVLSSNRVQTSINAAPWRYPVQEAFYRLLNDEQLGYSRVGDWQRRPGLGPFKFNDDTADESFINYDHPSVQIFQKQEPLGRSAFDLMMARAVVQPWQPTRHQVANDLLLPVPPGDLPIVNDARWSSGITSNSAVALLVWIALLVVIQVASAPLAAFLFLRMADKGWGCARLITILTVGYVVWIGSSNNLWRFSAIACWIALLVLAGAAWLCWRRFDETPRRRLIEWQSVRVVEIVFWAVFAFFLLLRVLNPDSWHPIWGGEKPMEFAHLNATLRSANFPPYDPWFSGGILNYYYYGLYLVALLIKLTGIPSEIAFNLAQPTVMALLASGAASIGMTISRDLAPRRWKPLLAALVPVGLILFIGNLASAARLIGQVAGSLQPGDSFVDRVWNPSRAISYAITEFPFFTGLYADLHAHAIALPITVLVIALAYAVTDTSTPSRGRWFAQIVALALVLGTLAATNAWDVPVYAVLAVAALWLGFSRRSTVWQRAVWFLASSIAVAAGAYLLFLPFHQHFVALFGSLALVRDPTIPGEWAVHIGGLAVIASLGVILLVLPSCPSRLTRYLSPLTLMVAFCAVGLCSIAFGLMSTETRLDLAPIVLGLLAIVLMLLSLAIAFTCVVDDENCGPGPAIGAFLLVTTVAAIGGAFVLERSVLGLAIAGLALSGTGWLRTWERTPRFVFLLNAAAWGVVAGVELFVVADDLIGGSWYRMNTVFKFYNQVWILFGLAAAAGVTLMIRDLTGGRIRVEEAVTEQTDGEANRRPASSLQWAGAGLAVSLVIVAASLVYPLLAISPRLEQRFTPDLGTGDLNSLSWMRDAVLPSRGSQTGEIRYAGDRAAIDWFNNNVAGSPVIAEASIGPYRCNGSRVSIATGLPTIIGWERHEQQQRSPAVLPERVADVETLYRSTNPRVKEALLRKYGVEYVVAGDLERAYPLNDNDCTSRDATAGVDAFRQMVGTTLEVAFESEGTTIYRVLPVSAASSISSDLTR